MSEKGQSRPRLPGLALPDVRYASISNQSFAAPRLVATGQQRPLPPRRTEPFRFERNGMYLFSRTGFGLIVFADWARVPTRGDETFEHSNLFIFTQTI